MTRGVDDDVGGKGDVVSNADDTVLAGVQGAELITAEKLTYLDCSRSKRPEAGPQVRAEAQPAKQESPVHSAYECSRAAGK